MLKFLLIVPLVYLDRSKFTAVLSTFNSSLITLKIFRSFVCYRSIWQVMKWIKYQYYDQYYSVPIVNHRMMCVVHTVYHCTMYILCTTYHMIELKKNMIYCFQCSKYGLNIHTLNMYWSVQKDDRSRVWTLLTQKSKFQKVSKPL